MNVARNKLILLALLTVLIVAAAPTSASALGPKPTLTGIPKLTNSAAVTYTLSTTVDSTWFVDFECAFNTALVNKCDYAAHPTCTVPANGQHTCTQTFTRQLWTGKHLIRFAADYCADATRSECEYSGGFVRSEIETYSFEVDRTKPVVKISSGPDNLNQVLKRGGGSFVFASTEALPFTCSIDDGAVAPCASPFTLPKWLKNGSHTFFVFATDAAGNQGGATRKFRVDVLQPKKCKKLKKGSSKPAKAKYKKCKAKNASDKKAWKKKHKLH